MVTATNEVALRRWKRFEQETSTGLTSDVVQNPIIVTLSLTQADRPEDMLGSSLEGLEELEAKHRQEDAS